ncbi:hypothetical protein AB0O91_27930 [Kitasatospora sp. NPDC089797]|uniref:hypothetical protein n=1 Tax=Kitasatospora sp. NPDC089797 TaxID=3155298 RepID=UPI0034289429
MGDTLRVQGDLTKAFSNFEDVSALVKKVAGEMNDIYEKNVRAGGGDDIGKQYHEKIDKPTEDLHTLTTDISAKIDAMAAHGKATVKLFHDTDQHNVDLTT